MKLSWKFSLAVVLLLLLTLGATAWLRTPHQPMSSAYIVVAAILAVLIPFLFHGLVGKRLNRVSTAMRQISAMGDLSQRIHDASRDEIGEMCATFNEMAAQLAGEKEKVRHHTRDLEALVDERTRHVEEALNKVEQASFQKTRFLASMSHEIRTPIGAILGYAEILEEPQTPPDERKQALISIRRNGEHLIELVNDILDLSKIEAGKLEIEMVECSVDRIIKDVISVMSVRAHAKGLRLDEIYLTPIPARIVSDPTRLRQVLINLVGNAVKFTERGLVTIALGYSGADSAQPRLEFRVQDTGIGIPPEKLDLLFKPFQQLGTDTTRKYGGTGLGLAISKQIARLLGGDIEVRSDPGLGSLFTFSIRCQSVPGTPMFRRPASAVLDEAKRSAPRNEAAVRPRPLRGRVLVVDDGVDNRKLFHHHLTGAGIQVELAENGKEGAEKAGASSFDIILMDIQMPVLDGFEALKEIREQGILTPIVALTAHAMKGDRERCIDAGFTDYLSKPVSRSELLGKVASFIRSTAPADDASPDAPAAPVVAPQPEAAPAAQEPAITGGEPTPTGRESAITFEAIVAEFRALLVAHADALKEAREAADSGELRRICHKLKGTAGAMGFDKVANLVASAYGMLEGPSPKCALPVVQELEQACREEAAAGAGKAGSVAVPHRAAGPRNHVDGGTCHSRT